MKEFVDCAQPGSAKLDLATSERACSGDEAAVIALIGPVQGPLLNLARRMVWHPDDAEDLVQEAVLRILTRLSSYRGEARFSTWAYRVAMNTMLTSRRRRMETASISFDQFGEDLERALAMPREVDDGLDRAMLAEEVKVGCMSGMLLCLDREARLAYILGEIFEVDGRMAASLCVISPAAFRQRLSRARKALHEFVRARCGQVSREASCHCDRMIEPAIAAGLVDPARLLFVKAGACRPAVARLEDAVGTIDETLRTVQLYRAHPDYAPTRKLEDQLREILRGRSMAAILSGDAGQIGR